MFHVEVRTSDGVGKFWGWKWQKPPNFCERIRSNYECYLVFKLHYARGYREKTSDHSNSQHCLASRASQAHQSLKMTTILGCFVIFCKWPEVTTRVVSKVMKYNLGMKLLVKRQILHSPEYLLKKIGKIPSIAASKRYYKNLALKLVEAKTNAFAIEAKRRRWNKKEVRPFLLSFNISIIISFTKIVWSVWPFSPCPWNRSYHGQQPTSCKGIQPATRRSCFFSTSRSTGEKSTEKWNIENHVYGITCLRYPPENHLWNSGNGSEDKIRLGCTCWNHHVSVLPINNLVVRFGCRKQRSELYWSHFLSTVWRDTSAKTSHLTK